MLLSSIFAIKRKNQGQSSLDANICTIKFHIDDNRKYAKKNVGKTELHIFFKISTQCNGFYSSFKYITPAIIISIRLLQALALFSDF